MANEPAHKREAVYHIRVRGVIGQQRAAWFDDLVILPLENGETLPSGPVVDQAALHGILARIRDLNLLLISVIRVSGERGDEAR